MEYLPVHLQWAQAIHVGKFAPYMEHNLRAHLQMKFDGTFV